jgi:mycothiol synthase
MSSASSVRVIFGPDLDAAWLQSIAGAAAAVDGAAPLNEAALLALRHRGLDGSTLFAAGEDGFAWVHDGEVDLVVAPAARRQGVGTALAGAVVEAFPDTALSAWSHGNHAGAAALAARFGLARVRDLWVMRRPLSNLPPLPERAGTDAYVVRTFRPGHDEDAFLALNAEAFAGHPEQGRMTRADLDQRMAEAWFDAQGFFVAEAPPEGSGALLGFHWTKVHDEEPAHGEVYVVGVSPRAQGSGLGRLLTLTGLHHLASLRLQEVILYVESDNAPAVAVYSRLGFTHADADTHVMYRRD